MSHFAKLDENNVVMFVTVGRQEDDGQEAELSARTGDVYKQTSYNTRGGVHYDTETGRPSNNQSKALRKNYASVGFTYDENRDAFIPPKPFESWVLDEDTCLWVAPTPYPGGDHRWNEEKVSWVPGDQPFASWSWNEQTLFWEPPVERPNNDLMYTWDEESGAWVAVTE